MKLRIAALALLVSMPLQAYAQGAKHKSAPSGNSSNSDAERRKRMDKEEAAAKAAMERVPDSKEKYDPWKIGK